MTHHTSDEPMLVALAPDVLAKSFLEAGHPRGRECRAVLRAWRDGEIRLAVTRPLLIAYLRLLRALKTPEERIRRWILWLTRPEKAFALLEKETPAVTGEEALIAAARRCGARAILSTRDAPPSLGEVERIPPAVLLGRLGVSAEPS